MSTKNKKAAAEVDALEWAHKNTTSAKPSPVPREHKSAMKRLARRGEVVVRVMEEPIGEADYRARLFGSVP